MVPTIDGHNQGDKGPLCKADEMSRRRIWEALEGSGMLRQQVYPSVSRRLTCVAPTMGTLVAGHQSQSGARPNVGERRCATLSAALIRPTYSDIRHTHIL